MPQPVSDTANIPPRQFRANFFCPAAKPSRSFADNLQLPFDRGKSFLICSKRVNVHSGGEPLNRFDRLDDVPERREICLPVKRQEQPPAWLVPARELSMHSRARGQLVCREYLQSDSECGLVPTAIAASRSQNQPSDRHRTTVEAPFHAHTSRTTRDGPRRMPSAPFRAHVNAQ